MSFLGPFDAFGPFLNAMGWDEKPAYRYRHVPIIDTRSVNPYPVPHAPADPRGWQDRHSVKIGNVSFSYGTRSHVNG